MPPGNYSTPRSTADDPSSVSPSQAPTPTISVRAHTLSIEHVDQILSMPTPFVLAFEQEDLSWQTFEILHVDRGTIREGLHYGQALRHGVTPHAVVMGRGEVSLVELLSYSPRSMHWREMIGPYIDARRLIELDDVPPGIGTTTTGNIITGIGTLDRYAAANYDLRREPKPVSEPEPEPGPTLWERLAEGIDL